MKFLRLILCVKFVVGKKIEMKFALYVFKLCFKLDKI